MTIVGIIADGAFVCGKMHFFSEIARTSKTVHVGFADRMKVFNALFT